MNLEEYAAYYLGRLAEDENAFFALIEAPVAIVPRLISAFRSESNSVRKSAILKVIWQRRNRSTISLLGEALQDASAGVWKEALDGLVALGGPEAKLAIEAAYGRGFDSNDDDRQFHGYLDEALEQLQTDRDGRLSN